MITIIRPRLLLCALAALSTINLPKKGDDQNGVCNSEKMSSSVFEGDRHHIETQNQKRNNLTEEERRMKHVFEGCFTDEMFVNLIRKHDKNDKSLLECILSFRAMIQYLMKKEDISLIWLFYQKNIFEDVDVNYIKENICDCYDAFTLKYIDVDVPVPDTDWVPDDLSSLSFDDEPKCNLIK